MSEQELIAKIKKLRSMHPSCQEWNELYSKLRSGLFKRGTSWTYIDYILLFDTNVVSKPQLL